MKKWSRVLWGLFFILAGALVITNTMGYLAQISLLSLLFLIVITPVLAISIYKINWFGILFSLAAAIIVFSEPLGLSAITPWPVLIAALLGSIGLSILFKKSSGFVHIIGSKGFSDDFDEIIDVEDEDVVKCEANFGSAIKYINSKNFKQGHFKCSFGAMKIYFDNAELSKDGAVVKLDVSFGGVEIFIPKEWNVQNNCDAVLGGFEERNSRRVHDPKQPTLTLMGNVSLGGVEITYI
jgi:predicted membrane protein